MSRVLAAALLLSAAPSAAFAQATHCAVPRELPRPHHDGPTADQPRRVLPIGHYTLALSWSPQYCASARDTLQCGRRNGRFGFTLHGLWPDGKGKAWPQYCRPARLLPDSVVRQNFCATPSPQLIQHEWAKHGTCMTTWPADYFDRARTLYGRVRYPDMAALARREGMTAGAFAAAFAKANPAMRADMMRVTATRNGWLDEVWLCLDTRFRPARCPAHKGGLRPSAKLRIRAPA